VDVRLSVHVEAANDQGVRLSDGTTVVTRTLVWGVGVAANPLIGRLGLPTRRGRLGVDLMLAVPGVSGVWAAGDAAAVPDLAARPQDGTVPDTPPTAQHAQRQGKVLGRNVAASLGIGHARRYRHKDLGLVADLGGWDAVARPLGVPLTGPLAKVVTRAYHLYALPAMANRVRVATDWLFQTVLPPESTQLSVVRPEDARLASAQGTFLTAEAAATDDMADRRA
jgi:NADH dehydrogenase